MKKAFPALLLLLFLTACTSRNTRPVTKEIFAMDTVMSLTCYGPQAEDAIDAAIAEINRLDKLWSVGVETSEISRINREGSGRISEETEEVIKTALRLYEETEGALDITVYPLMELWGFTGDRPSVPDAGDIEKLLPLVDAGLLETKEGTLKIQEGQGIDLGAVAKGYTSHRIAGIMRGYEVTGGIISLGGNVQCFGKKPQKDRSLWTIGIRRPDGNEGYLGILTTTEKAVVTSGGYERFFEENGQTYHHILDPSTGYPADSGLKSVTIVSGDGTLADGLSTACFVMGLDRSVEYWQKHSDEFDMILLTEEDDLYVTKPLLESFSSEEEIHEIEPGQ